MIAWVRCEIGDHMADIKSCLPRISGYEKPREGGGANQIVLREQTGTYACWECVEKKKAHIDAGQGTLL